MSTKPTTITAPDGVPFIEIVREFDAPVAAVFRAYVEPELVKQWTGPNGYEMTITEWDLTTGGRYAYVINELALTVTVFTRDATSGALTEVQSISTLPAGQAAEPSFSTAEVVVHPSGKFLYGSNRGHDSLVVFAIDDKTGKLTLVQHVPTQGKTPRGFGVDPTGRYLLAGNQQSDSVVVFRIDATSGRLTPTGQTLKVGSPVSVVFVPVN